MELNNFETLDRHPLHTEAVSDSNDWAIPKHAGWDEQSQESPPQTLVIVELPCSNGNNKQINSISSPLSPLSVNTDSDGSAGASVDYLELGLFSLVVLAVAIVILRD